jgi:hypothetical protein
MTLRSFSRIPLVSLVSAVLFLASCLPPIFDQSSKARVADKSPPSITITSPQDGSPYSSAIQVTGTARDLADSSGTPGHVASLNYEVLATGTSGSAGVAADGTFNFTFLAGSLHGPITLRLTAVDWNGNVGQASVTLVDSGSGIPGFTAVAASGLVTLTWPGVPLVDHYELYYETSDMLPSEQFSTKVSPVTTGYTLSGLANGHVHAFLLKSIPVTGSGAAVNWSAVQKVIPLSQAQLVPRVQPASGSITVSWTAISASVSYEVWKGSTSNTTGFVNISGTIQGSSFVDAAVQTGQTYYYAVKPAQYSQLLSWPTSATPSPFPLNSRREIANVTTSGAVSSAALSADGRYLYAVDAQAGIVVYDVSTPSSPVKRGTLAPTSQPGYPTDASAPATVPFAQCALSPSGYLMAISWVDNGNNVDYGRLSVVDVSNPDNPQEVAFYNTGTLITQDFAPTGFAVRGNRVFLEEFTWASTPRMVTVDFDPIGKTLTPRAAANVQVNGTASPQVEASADGAFAYSVNYSGIEVFSVNPSTGVLTYQGAVTTGGGDGADCARFFTVSTSKYLYLGYYGGLRIINVTTPTAPSVVSSWATPSQVTDIQVSSNRAYVSTGGSGLLIYDVSAPLSPTAAGSFQVVPSAVDSAVYGNNLYLALGYPMHGFKVLDVTMPTLANVATAAGSANLSSLALTDRYAYAANFAALDIYDISSGSPVHSATVGLPGGGGGLAVSGNILVTGASTVTIYDITNPLSPVQLASIPVPNYVQDVRITGSLVFVACRDFGLKIIDISTPSSPKELGSLGLGNPTYSLAPMGSYVFVTHGYTRMAVVDVSNPLAPRLVNDYVVSYYGPLGNQNWGYHVEVAANYAYLAEGTGGIVILDVSNPGSPVDKGHVSPPASLQDYMSVAVQGEYAYIARQNSMVSLINIADPANPVLVTSLTVPGGEYLNSIAATGNRVYAVSSGGTTGLVGSATK